MRHSGQLLRLAEPMLLRDLRPGWNDRRRMAEDAGSGPDPRCRGCLHCDDRRRRLRDCPVQCHGGGPDPRTGDDASRNRTALCHNGAVRGSARSWPGPNSAVWSSVAVIPSATLSPPGSTPSSGISSIEWDFIVILVIVGVLIAVVAWSRRGRGLSVTVLDSGTLSPISGAAVSADGPRSYSGTTAANGTAIFVAVRPGEYSVNAVAPGYVAIRPERIVIRKSAAHTLRLGSITESAPVGMTPLTPASGPNHPHVEPTVSTVQPLRPALAPGIAAMPPTGTPPGEASAGAGDDFGGERIREIIRTFRTKGALSPETALPAEELGLSRIFVRIMKRRRGKTKVFIEVNGKYYLDENALRGMS